MGLGNVKSARRDQDHEVIYIVEEGFRKAEP